MSLLRSVKSQWQHPETPLWKSAFPVPLLLMSSLSELLPYVKLKSHEVENSCKAQNAWLQLLCDSKGGIHSERPEQGGKQKVLMRYLHCYLCFSHYSLLKAQLVILVSHSSGLFFLLFLLAAWEYPVREPRGQSNKNYWFWIGKKVHACILTNHKWIRKQWKKYCTPAMMTLIHNDLLLFLG